MRYLFVLYFYKTITFRWVFFFFFGGERHKKKEKIIIILLIFLIEKGYGDPNECDLK